MGFPAPQKNKMEYFIHHLYEDKGKEKLSKQDFLPEVEKFKFAPDVQVFFEDLPERDYDEKGLIDALNDVIDQRGRAGAIGGRLEKRDQFSEEWERAYPGEFESRP